MTDRRPGQGRYAKLEREQRWLLTQLPPGLTGERVIVDHYWTGTSLRLRLIEGHDGVHYKLCQKVRLDDDDPAMVKITNIYVNEAEFLTLSVTPAAIISKSRWTWNCHGVPYAVDEFKGRHAGLVLAEVELGENDPSVSDPDYVAADVTHDDRYSGGWLATASNEELRRVVHG